MSGFEPIDVEDAPTCGAPKFHFGQFTLDELLRAKASLGVRISVAIPTLNEGSTIGTIVQDIRRNLMDAAPLVDELAVIDSGSTDGTQEAARTAGAQVFGPSDGSGILGDIRGKGENLWRSLYFLSGDIIVWIDGDIKNFNAGFISGLLGPLLTVDGVAYTTGYYDRPLQLPGSPMLPNEGGRVTELLVRPFLSCLLPELSGIHQPIGGEHAGYRRVLETLPFFTSYEVDLGILIDIVRTHGLTAVAQVNLEQRIHKNRPLADLHLEAMGILRALLRRAEQWGRLRVLDGDLRTTASCFGRHDSGHPGALGSVERPPIITLPAYRRQQEDRLAQRQEGGYSHAL